MTATGRGTGPDTSTTLTDDYRKREESITLSSQPAGVDETHELLTLNIGPHHPSTHGVLRLLALAVGHVERGVASGAGGGGLVTHTSAAPRAR